MRAFVAAEVSDCKVINLIRDLQSDMGIDARPVSPDILHFTLQFLGEVPGEIMPRVAGALRTVRFGSFDVTLTGVGAFPGAGSPRTVWVGSDRDGGRLLGAPAARVRRALKPLGFAPGGTFRPHVTVFRMRGRADISEEIASRRGLVFGSQRIGSIKLKSSELTPSGPAYSDVEEIPAS